MSQRSECDALECHVTLESKIRSRQATPETVWNRSWGVLRGFMDFLIPVLSKQQRYDLGANGGKTDVARSNCLRPPGIDATSEGSSCSISSEKESNFFLLKLGELFQIHWTTQQETGWDTDWTYDVSWVHHPFQRKISVFFIYAIVVVTLLLRADNLFMMESRKGSLNWHRASSVDGIRTSMNA